MAVKNFSGYSPIGIVSFDQQIKKECAEVFFSGTLNGKELTKEKNSWNVSDFYEFLETSSEQITDAHINYFRSKVLE